MKIQIRRSVLTFQYEVQVQDEGKATWNTRGSFKTQVEAEAFAKSLTRTVKVPRAKRIKKTKK